MAVKQQPTEDDGGGGDGGGDVDDEALVSAESAESAESAQSAAMAKVIAGWRLEMADRPRRRTKIFAQQVKQQNTPEKPQQLI